MGSTGTVLPVRDRHNVCVPLKMHPKYCASDFRLGFCQSGAQLFSIGPGNGTTKHLTAPCFKNQNKQWTPRWVNLLFKQGGRWT